MVLGVINHADSISEVRFPIGAVFADFYNNVGLNGKIDNQTEYLLTVKENRTLTEARAGASKEEAKLIAACAVTIVSVKNLNIPG